MFRFRVPTGSGPAQMIKCPDFGKCGFTKWRHSYTSTRVVTSQSINQKTVNVLRVYDSYASKTVKWLFYGIDFQNKTNKKLFKELLSRMKYSATLVGSLYRRTSHKFNPHKDSPLSIKSHHFRRVTIKYLYARDDRDDWRVGFAYLYRGQRSQRSFLSQRPFKKFETAWNGLVFLLRWFLAVHAWLNCQPL